MLSLSKSASAGSKIAGILAAGTAPSLYAAGANERIRLALLGCGGRGTDTILNCIRLNKGVSITRVCDVNTTKLASVAKRVAAGNRAAGVAAAGAAPAASTRMEDVFADTGVDAVWVSTPEHWHTLASIYALRAGKHVYVEKNLSVNIWEGRQLVRAAREHRRVVQVGYQNRSAPYGFAARDYIAAGKLGSIVTVKCYGLLGGGKVKRTPDRAAPPAYLGAEGWDRWLGPAPARKFNSAIVSEHGRGGWNYFWAYSGGNLADDSSHVFDLARLALGDPAHPRAVYAVGGNRVFGGESETPEVISVVFDFGQFSLSCDTTAAGNGYMTKTPREIRFDPKRFPTWRNNLSRIEIYGTKGMMYLGRHGGGWQVLGAGNKIVEQCPGRFPDDEHQTNFIAALRGTAKPNGDVEQGHLSSCMVHLANIAHRTGNHHLVFDAATEQFTAATAAGDATGSESEILAAANRLARGTHRKGYEVPEYAA